MMIPVLYLVIPCYNEEAVLPETSKELLQKYETLMQMQKISPLSKIVFVNDGSKDKTWQLIQQYHNDYPEIFSGICLAHNSGHQNAILAGMLTVKDLCDAVITMDADLQDDIDTIDKMVEEFAKGLSSGLWGAQCKKDRYLFQALDGGKLLQAHANDGGRIGV